MCDCCHLLDTDRWLLSVCVLPSWDLASTILTVLKGRFPSVHHIGAVGLTVQSEASIYVVITPILDLSSTLPSAPCPLPATSL